MNKCKPLESGSSEATRTAEVVLEGTPDAVVAMAAGAYTRPLLSST